MEIIPVGNNKKYWDEILKIRNENCFGFGNDSIISQDIHYDFMKKHYDNYFVLFLSDIQRVVGFVGCVNNDIRVAVHSDFKKMGLGKDLILFIKNKYPNSIAKVKPDNIASLKLFQSCGFKNTWCIYE